MPNSKPKSFAGASYVSSTRAHPKHTLDALETAGAEAGAPKTQNENVRFVPDLTFAKYLVTCAHKYSGDIDGDEMT